MTATFTSTTAYTMAQIAQFYQNDGKIYNIINALAQNNPILDHALWLQGNLTSGHRGKIVTSLPSADFRRLYQGTPYSKSGVATVEEPCRQISSRFGVDIDELRLYEGDAQNAFRWQEGLRHVESMRQKCMNQLIYGSPDADPDQLRGLAAHYNYSDGPNVVDAGGTGSDVCTSIWGVVWGVDAFHGIYPKNMPAGVQHEDLGVFDAEDANGYKFRAVGDEWKWNLGFFLADWRMCVRICNIKVANLSVMDHTSVNFIDLNSLTIDAEALIPSGYRDRIRWYVGKSVMKTLKKHSSNPYEVNLYSGDWGNAKKVTMLQGHPVFECDGISEAESVLDTL